jgi:predicted DNA binding protein
MGDTDTADFSALVAKLEPNKRYTFAEIAEIADDAGLFERIFCEKEKDGELSRAGKRRLSDLLGRFDRRRVSASCVFFVEGKGHSRRYAVVSPRRMHDTHDTHDISAVLEKTNFSERPKYHAHHAGHAYASDLTEEELAEEG